LVELKLDFLGKEHYLRGFNRIAAEVQDFNEPFRILIDDYREMEKRIFGSEGSSEGEQSFKPLSKKYREWKEAYFPEQSIMVLTGALRAALTGKTSGTVEQIEKRSAEFGTDIKYAHRHQVGYKMPERRVVQVNEDAKNRWSRIMVRWAAGLFDKYGIANYGQYINYGGWTA
jgi:hypothetical protein